MRDLSFNLMDALRESIKREHRSAAPHRGARKHKARSERQHKTTERLDFAGCVVCQSPDTEKRGMASGSRQMQVFYSPNEVSEAKWRES
jgi:hypothetical protein